MQDLASPNRIARHQGNHHLGEATNQALQIQHIEPRQTRLIHIAAIAAHALVATGTEGPAPIGGGAGTGEQHNPHGGVIPHPAEGITQLLHRARPKRIALVGPVDGDTGEAIAAQLKKDVLVGPGRLPLGNGGSHAGGPNAWPILRSS